MQTSPKPSFFIKPSFLNRDSDNISRVVSLVAFVILVLLSIVFVWHNASSRPSQSSIGKDNQPRRDQSITA